MKKNKFEIGDGVKIVSGDWRGRLGTVAAHRLFENGRWMYAVNLPKPKTAGEIVLCDEIELEKA